MFVLKTLESTDPIPSPFIALIMKPTVAIGNLLGKPAKFTFNRGNYLEENILGSFPYALGGFPSKRQAISFGQANGFRPQYGTLTLEEGCTNDHIVSPAVLTRRLGASATFIRSGRAYHSLLHLACCEYTYTRGTGQLAPRGTHLGAIMNSCTW